MDSLGQLASEQFCYLTTRGRVSGQVHTVELWFALSPGSRTLYILSGGGARSDWVKNILYSADVAVRIGETNLSGKGRIVEGGAEEQTAREMVVRKYYRRAYDPQGGWEAQSLPIAVDLEGIITG